MCQMLCGGIGCNKNPNKSFKWAKRLSSKSFGGRTFSRYTTSMVKGLLMPLEKRSIGGKEPHSKAMILQHSSWLSFTSPEEGLKEI